MEEEAVLSFGQRGSLRGTGACDSRIPCVRERLGMNTPAFPLTLADRLTIRHFRKAVPQDARTRFDHSLDAIVAAERPFVTDAATHTHTIIGACAVSLYRAQISQGCDRARAKAKVRAPMMTLWKRSMRSMMWATSLFSRDVFEALRRYTKTRGANAFGAGFEIDYCETGDGFVSEVKTCGYLRFLERHDARDLLDLFCEWDRIWIDALPKSVRFHRPPTQAQGAATCRFEFRRR